MFEQIILMANVFLARVVFDQEESKLQLETRASRKVQIQREVYDPSRGTNILAPLLNLAGLLICTP